MPASVDSIMNGISYPGLALSYGFMIVTLYIYGAMMATHVYYLLFVLGIAAVIVFFLKALWDFMHLPGPLRYDVHNTPFLWAEGSLNRHWILYRGGSPDESVLIKLWRAVRSPASITGFLSAINYVAVAFANPHVPSLNQVIMSLAQFPFVILFSFILLKKKYPWQLVLPVLIPLLAGVVISNYSNLAGGVSSGIGWNLLYLLSTIPIPVLNIIFEHFLKKRVSAGYQPLNASGSGDDEVGDTLNASWALAWLNLWMLIYLILFAPINAAVPGNFGENLLAALRCSFTGRGGLAGDICPNSGWILLALTACVVVNFACMTVVVRGENAYFSTLMSAIGPCIATVMFSVPAFMGQYYDVGGVQSATYTYLGLALVFIGAAMYKVMIATKCKCCGAQELGAVDANVRGDAWLNRFTEGVGEHLPREPLIRQGPRGLNA